MITWGLQMKIQNKKYNSLNGFVAIITFIFMIFALNNNDTNKLIMLNTLTVINVIAFFNRG